VSITNILIAVNVVAYVWLTSTGGLSSNEALLQHGALLGIACTEYGQWWRIVTGGFLHGGIAHIALNMIALYQVGNIVELMFGRVRYVLLYAIALVGSGLAVVYAAPSEITVGASGAIFGLFGALVAVGLRHGKRGRSLITQVVPVIAINLVFTFTFPNISAAGHIGGLLTGFVAGLLLYMVPSTRSYAYAYVTPPQDEPGVVTIDQPPEAAAHEEAGAPPLEHRDPRE
jgi:rhomboid protease GluP